mmetsp:Transcript_15694/g.28634  ORF Transcript_15694/g.28634 Transcript_15694/m.28634 type:complete len:303 (-) Transcript_15694:380-1288(-)
MSTQPRQKLRQLVHSPETRTSSSELFNVLHTRSATTLNKITTLQFPRDPEPLTKVFKTPENFEAFSSTKSTKRSESGKNSIKKRRNGGSQPDVRELLRENVEHKSESTKIRSPANIKIYEEELALEQCQEKLLSTMTQVAELKQELKCYDRFFEDLYEFFTRKDTSDPVAEGLHRMRSFYKMRKKPSEASEPSKPETPDVKQFEFKQAKINRQKSELKIPGSYSPYTFSKTTRNFPVKISRMLSPQAKLQPTTSLKIFSSSRSTTPIDQLESTSEKLEFIKLRTLEVLEAWKAESTGRGKRG